MGVARVAEAVAREGGMRETDGRGKWWTGTSCTRPLPHGAPDLPFLGLFRLPRSIYALQHARRRPPRLARHHGLDQDSNEFRLCFLAQHTRLQAQ